MTVRYRTEATIRLRTVVRVMNANYDVIVVGARVAGASTAALLARRGLRVLVVDRAGFPSDTLSTHQVQLPGIVRLARWGLLPQIIASGAPATRRARFTQGSVILDGRYPVLDGFDAMYSPRRTVLDAILLEAAAQSGADVQERFIVDEIMRDGDRVIGIRGTAKAGSGGRGGGGGDWAGSGIVSATADLVVGADGKHSLVARAAGAPVYRFDPPRTMCSYSYFDGVDLDAGEMRMLDRQIVTAWPTNDGLAMAACLLPVAGLATFRADVEGNTNAVFRSAGDLGERILAGRRVERYRSTPDLPNAMRQPFGPGWALVGDAGLVLDPISAQGIAHALQDAELLADAIVDGLGGRLPLDEALSGYWRQRDLRSGPMYDLTIRLAGLAPPSRREQALLASLEGRPAEISRFLGMLAGIVPVRGYFGAPSMFRALGLRGLHRLLQPRPADRSAA